MALDRNPHKIDVFTQILQLPGDAYLEGMLQGKICDVVKQLKDIEVAVMRMDFWDVTLKCEGRYDSQEYELWAWRKETDHEYTVRWEKISKAQERERLNILKNADKLEAAKVEAVVREAKEREILRILKEKYPE